MHACNFLFIHDNTQYFKRWCDVATVPLKGNLIHACRVLACHLDVARGQMAIHLRVYEKYPLEILPVTGILVESTRYVFVSHAVV